LTLKNGRRLAFFFLNGSAKSARYSDGLPERLRNFLRVGSSESRRVDRAF
jgi:hypothetical protein